MLFYYHEFFKYLIYTLKSLNLAIVNSFTIYYCWHMWGSLTALNHRIELNVAIKWIGHHIYTKILLHWVYRSSQLYVDQLQLFCSVWYFHSYLTHHNISPSSVRLSPFLIQHHKPLPLPHQVKARFWCNCWATRENLTGLDHNGLKTTKQVRLNTTSSPKILRHWIYG
jgi:hypothetical protein